jgi:2-methylcitrate dehydratase PrpD
MSGADGRQVIAAIIAGYEVQIRLSLALVPKDHYERGYHPSATCGTFGAAAAAARVLGLSAEQTVSALGACLSQTAGTMQFLADGSWNKLFQVGYAAFNGVVAATLAADGFYGAREAIEGNKGFLHAYSPHAIPEKAVHALGEIYETLNIAVKPYPSCRYSHAALDAVIGLKAANDIDDGEIDSVEVGLPRTGWNIIGNPQADKHNPESVVDGQFSMPFVAAVALREGRMGWDDYLPHLKDAKTLALCKRINTTVDAKAEAEFPVNMSGIVRIRTKRGEFERFVVVPKGEPDNFLTLAELRAKFDSLVAPYLTKSQNNRLAEELLSLEKCRDISTLLALTYPEKTPAISAVGDD